MDSAVEQEIKGQIRKRGRIPFAEFQQACLYSPHGGFYSSRADRIGSHFRTSPTSHPAFGALILRQLEQMWRLLGSPRRFDIVEVGSGDGALARSIVREAGRSAPDLVEALRYVAADYAPWWPATLTDALGWDDPVEASPSRERERIDRVRAEGLGPFREIVGCILCNELLDNFPVHRFVIQDGRVKEAFVTFAEGRFTEVLDEPSTPRIAARLADLGLSLPDEYRGEVNLAMEDWVTQAAASLERGFVLTVDYGELAPDLYSPRNADGTLVCFSRHSVGDDPYLDVGGQDITSQVDFTSLMRLGERQGFVTAGYTLQRRFLGNLGLSEFLDAIGRQGLSEARQELRRMALLALVDPDQMGDFKVLAQAKGVASNTELLGFRQV